MSEVTNISGSCHCRNIRFDLRWPTNDTEIPRRLCGCSFCQKHGGAWTSHRDAELVVTIEDASLVSKYRFGTKTADFYICRVCGVAPFVLSEIDDKQYTVVNVNTFENTDEYSYSNKATNFDGENTGSRLERRKRNWIPKVSLISPVT